VRRFALLLLPVLLAGSLTACGGASGSTSSSDVKVSGSYGSKPKVTVTKGAKPAKKLEVDVLEKGDGPKVAKGDLLVADYLGKVFKSGKVFDNSYDRKVPASFPIGIGGVIPGWDKALVGVEAGSRVLMVVPPKDGYGKTGNSQAGIKGTDSLIFVVDVIASYSKSGATLKDTPATGIPTDLPKVAGEPGAEPTITVPAGTTPPKSPLVTVLAKGTGPEVAKNKLAVVEYTAVNWTGKALSSSWQKDEKGVRQGPQGVPIGGAQPSPFDLLVGVPAGSRVLLTLPAQDGTDATKESVAVVIDVLGVHGPAKGDDK
jgi:peptidylprolyl isomerase